MDDRISIRFISQEDQIKAGCFDFPMVIKTVENALRDFENGKILFPEKIIQQFRDMPQDRINCMPSTLLEEKICGVKWVSVFNENPSKHHKQSICGVMVLSEITTGYPVYFMDATLCSSMRVAGIGALGAKYFARSDSKRIGLIGAGEQAKTHVLAIKSAVPSVEECLVCGLSENEEKRFAEEIQPYAESMRIIPAGQDPFFAMKDADILVTATPSTRPLVTAEMVKEGAYISQIGPFEVSPEAVMKCDKTVCDNWNAIKHRGSQPLTMLAEQGILSEDNIIDISKVAAGLAPARENEKERIYFKHVGLSYLDLAIALQFARIAESKGIGQVLTLQESMLFSHHCLKEHCRI